MLPRYGAAVLGALGWAAAVGAAEFAPLPGVTRVVFLGDSITHSGQFIEFVEAWVVSRFPDRRLEFLNLGLPSETVSGLSEPGHAGGQFPRPVLDERLDRVLAQTKPDLVIAGYGMNDGIYYPFAEERFQKFQSGILRLRAKVIGSGAKIIHLTPPTFDPLPLQGRTLPEGLAEYRSPFAGYNDVLDRYSEWLLAQRASGWDVVDVHGPMNAYLAAQRKADPEFRLANDGIHAGSRGHWIIARALLLHLGAPADLGNMSDPADLLAAYPQGPKLLSLVQQRQRLLRDSWLSAVGHERPGMAKGLPLAEAQTQAAALGKEIAAIAAPFPGKRGE